MNVIKTIVKIGIFGFLLFVVFILITSRTGSLGIQSMVVLTGSMEPSISTGSVIFVTPADFYQTGEAIAFKNIQGITITHRIVEKLDQDGAIVFKTRGDANNSPDSELIPKSSVIGKQVFTVPYLGRLTAFLRTPIGFVALIIVPAIIFILGELITIKKEMEKQIKKKVLEEINTNP